MAEIGVRAWLGWGAKVGQGAVVGARVRGGGGAGIHEKAEVGACASVGPFANIGKKARVGWVQWGDELGQGIPSYSPAYAVDSKACVARV